MTKKWPVGLVILTIFYLAVGVGYLQKMPLFGSLYLVCGIGLILRKKIMLYFAILFSVFGIGNAIFEIFQKHEEPLMIWALLLTCLVHGSIISYLTRPGVKECFK